MGACASAAKNAAAGVDKEAVMQAVKGRKVEIAQRAQTLASDYTTRIDAGQTVVINPMEVLPLKDTTGLKLSLDATSTPADRLKTALYVATNTLWRDAFIKIATEDLTAGMKKSGMPDAIVKHAGSGAGPLINAALDKQVSMMADSASKGDPLVTAEEIREVEAYKAAHPVASAAPVVAPSDIKLQEKDASATQGAPVQAAPASGFEKANDMPIQAPAGQAAIQA